MKSGHRLKLSGMLISIASLVLTAISPASADMLAEEVSAAIQTHPEIASLNFQAGAARSQIGQAFAGYLPTLDARAAGRLGAGEGGGDDRTDVVGAVVRRCADRRGRWADHRVVDRGGARLAVMAGRGHRIGVRAGGRGVERAGGAGRAV